MKILHIGKYFPPFRGGMENFLEDLTEEQVYCGHKVWVLCHQHETGHPTLTEELYNGLRVTRTEIKGILAYAPIAPDFFRQLEKILQSFSPDVVHVHMPNLSAFFLLLFKSLPKLVLQWQSDVVSSDYDVKLKILYPFYKIFEKQLLLRAHVIIASSESYLRTSLPLKRFQKKCRVVPLGISMAKMKRFAQQSQVFHDLQSHSVFMSDHIFKQKDFILAVGRFAYYKGFEYLIKACAQGFEGYVVIVGDGPLKVELEKLVRQLSLQERIFMPGILPDNQLHQLLSECTAFCLPSIERTEAFGLVLLEAMYYDKPLITTNVIGSGMNEVNVHNETGLVVAPENSSELAEAMNVMVHNNDLSKAMGRKGRERLLEKFDIVGVADRIEKLY